MANQITNNKHTKDGQKENNIAKFDSSMGEDDNVSKTVEIKMGKKNVFAQSYIVDFWFQTVSE